jgi:hypothetical protein
MPQIPEKSQQISFNSRLTDDRSTIPKPLQSNPISKIKTLIYDLATDKALTIAPRTLLIQPN